MDDSICNHWKISHSSKCGTNYSNNHIHMYIYVQMYVYIYSDDVLGGSFDILIPPASPWGRSSNLTACLQDLIGHKKPEEEEANRSVGMGSPPKKQEVASTYILQTQDTYPLTILNASLCVASSFFECFFGASGASV